MKQDQRGITSCLKYARDILEPPGFSEETEEI
jgi:hypothetical protein